MRAFERLGYTVQGIHTIEPWRRVRWYVRQLQRRLGRGPVVDEINRQVLSAARDFRPDLVWAEKQEFVRPDTLEELRRLGSRLIHFTPDPYFTLDWKRTSLMDEAMGLFDVLVYCKSYERAEYEALGKSAIYMPLGYCDEVHRHLPSTDPRWHCMVGFVGGWEPRRERLLHAVAASRVQLKIWGAYWDFLEDGRWTLRRQIVLKQLAGQSSYSIHKDPLLSSAHQGGEVYSDDYARALTGAKIGLGFLRQVCPDQHTTRTFEIPACGSLLLADRTDEHQCFFEEGREAEFFSSEAEMLDKVTFYLSHDVARNRVISAGMNRCVAGGYSYTHRVRAVLDKLCIE